MVILTDTCWKKRDILYGITYMWNINYATICTFLQNRNKLRNTENKKEREWGRAKLGIWH